MDKEWIESIIFWGGLFVILIPTLLICVFIFHDHSDVMFVDSLVVAATAMLRYEIRKNKRA